MALHCPSCKRVIYDEQMDRVINNTCFCCGETLVEEKEMTYETARIASKEAHNRDIAAYNKSQSAMCFVIIGATVLIIGILFIFLSLLKKKNVIVGINFVSFQFFIAAAGILTGVTLLTLGFIFLAKALKNRKLAKRDINYLATLKEKLRLAEKESK